MRFASGSAHGLQNNLLAPVFDTRPQPDLLPPGEGSAIARLFIIGRPSGQPSRRFFKETADDSPSPWGEGRVEGGRETYFATCGLRQPPSFLTIFQNFASWCLGGEKLNCLHVARRFCPFASAHRVFIARWRLSAGPAGGQGA